MEFLTAALYKTPTSDSDELLLTGALLTSFNPNDRLSRASVYYENVEGLRSPPTTDFRPMGFCFDDNGVLLADTGCRKDMESELAEYVGRGYVNPVRPQLGLIDLVLYGAEFGAGVVANPNECEKGASAIVIPFSSFKVSESSLNIYAPYKNSDNKFRTFSLVDIETDQAYPLVISVPMDAVRKMSPVSKLLEPEARAILVDGSQVFSSKAQFTPAPTLTGEAFCNYLTYNVAYCRLGLKVIDSFLGDGGFVSEPREEEEAERVYKKPKHNLFFQSNLRKPCVQKVLDRLAYPDDLRMLCEHDAEAAATMAWFQKIMMKKDDMEGEDDQSKILAACVNLKASCKRSLLHFACELLAQRLYLCNLGITDNSIGLTLKGGGVSGCAIKRTSW